MDSRFDSQFLLEEAEDQRNQVRPNYRVFFADQVPCHGTDFTRSYTAGGKTVILTQTL